MEKQVVKEVAKHFKSKGCFVMIITVVPGIPVGTPDVWAFHEGLYMVVECKANAKSPYRPLQKKRLELFDDWSMAWTVHSDNLDEWKKEIDNIFI